MYLLGRRWKQGMDIIKYISPKMRKLLTFPLSQGPLLLTWIDFNPSMDK